VTNLATNKRSRFYLLLVLAVVSPAYAGDCNAPVTTCATAELIKRDLMKGLPQQVSQNMTITHVMRVNAEIHLYTQLSYDMAFLESSMRSKGATAADARRVIQSQAQNYFCSNAQLKRGVGFYNHYKLSDGREFVTTKVMTCAGW
jgi:hypothetical protein